MPDRTRVLRFVRELVALALLAMGALWVLYLSIFLFGSDGDGDGIWAPVAVCMGFALAGMGLTLAALAHADRWSAGAFTSGLAAAVALHALPFMVWSAAA